MFQEVPGGMLHYQQWGSGHPLILLHGNGEDLTIFNEAAQVLSERFCVYALDLPGHGRSHRPQVLHYRHIAQAIRSFIRSLGLDKPYLYGFSDGGIIGLMLAIDSPHLLSKLVISGANLEPEGLRLFTRMSTAVRCRLTGSEIIGLMLAIDSPHLLSKLVISGANLEPEGLRLFTRMSTAVRCRLTGSEKAQMMLSEPYISTQSLGSITVPTFVTAGQFDCIKPAHTQLIAASIPGSRLDIFPGQLHGSYVVHSPKIAQYLLSVL